jgi:RND family efflux transporter MFP subunit
MKKIIVLLGIAITLLLSCSNEETDEVTSSSWDQEGEYVPIAVEVLDVTKGQLIPYIEASGVIKGIREAWVSSGSQGKISSLNVTLGSEVKADQVLLTVENDLQKLNRDLALQQYESARLDFEALESSYKKGGLSRSDFNGARTRLLQAETAYRSADKAYDDTFIKAPFSGSVALLDDSLAVGATLAPGTPVALVIDRSSMKMNISLGERQVSLIKTGQKARVEISSGFRGQTVEAEVEAIGSGSDSSTGSFPLLIKWNEGIDESMRSGLSARVLMENTREEPSILVPSSAIIVRNRKPSVLVALEGRAVLKEIVPGESLGGNTLIEEGLEVGEKLIVSALSSLGDGYFVEMTEVGKTGEWK